MRLVVVSVTVHGVVVVGIRPRQGQGLALLNEPRSHHDYTRGLQLATCDRSIDELVCFDCKGRRRGFAMETDKLQATSFTLVLDFSHLCDVT